MEIIEKETDIQTAILRYLSYKKDIFFYRCNNIPPVNKFADGRMTFRKMPFGSINGVPDIVVIKDGKYIGLEVKTKKGRQSKYQKEFQEKLEKAGGLYYIVRSLEDAKNIIEG